MGKKNRKTQETALQLFQMSLLNCLYASVEKEQFAGNDLKILLYEWKNSISPQFAVASHNVSHTIKSHFCCLALVKRGLIH